MRKIRHLLKFVLLLLLIAGCNLTNSVNDKREDIELTFVDAASIEAWVEIKSNINMPSWKVSIMQNGNYLYDINLLNPDTIICLSSLTPKTSYEIYAVIDGKKSNMVSFTTLDTTSHDITWLDYKFGDDNGNNLQSIAIIDDEHVNAVGAIYKNGEFLDYNIVKYNGYEWGIDRALYYSSQGSIFAPQLFSIHNVNNDSYWVGSATPMMWNGSKYLQWTIDTTIFRSRIFAIGGNSNDNIYIGGSEGHLAYYNGTKWQKVNSKTNLAIAAIKAYNNYKTGIEEVLCVAVADVLISPERSAIIKITDKTNTTIEELPMRYNYLNIWTNKGYPVYVAGGGIYSNKTGKWIEIEVPSRYKMSRINANGLNDIIAYGYREIAHYNGATWCVYNINEGPYRDLDIKGNLIALCGSDGSKALIKIGIRN